MYELYRTLFVKWELFIRYAYRRRGVLFRVILSWFIAALTLFNDEINNLDYRLNFRGPRTGSNEIVQLVLKRQDLKIKQNMASSIPLDLIEYTELDDSFFWDTELWENILGALLKYNPQKIGILFYFGENIGPINLTSEQTKLFFNPKVYWSSSVNIYEQLKLPKFTSRNNKNIGRNDLYRDNDGIVRRYLGNTHSIPHLAELLVNKSASFLINFRGAKDSFKSVQLSELLYDDLPADVFKDKIVLIGGENIPGARFTTPIGTLSRLDIFSNIVDNLIENRTPYRLPTAFYLFFLFALEVLLITIISRHPQQVTIFVFFWIGLILSAFSAWLFDTFSIWMPALSSIVLIAITWIIFIGYQATQIERKNFELKQEQKYLNQLEILKNNFVSLISHDLKTPIAKIHAVVQRMINQNSDPNIQQDLQSLLIFNEELNRYIQSILKVLRVESRDFKLHKEAADINDVIQNVIDTLSPLAKEKNISLISELEPMFSLEFDTTLIFEVIQNLIENAIKYTQSGGVVKITSKEIDNFIYVEIVDNGAGIKSEDTDKVWGKFIRGSDQDLKTKGSGLGLYLVKYFIELHGGTVSLQSEVNKGTSVTFTLPILEANESSFEVEASPVTDV